MAFIACSGSQSDFSLAGGLIGVISLSNYLDLPPDQSLMELLIGGGYLVLSFWVAAPILRRLSPPGPPAFLTLTDEEVIVRRPSAEGMLETRFPQDGLRLERTASAYFILHAPDGRSERLGRHAALRGGDGRGVASTTSYRNQRR